MFLAMIKKEFKQFFRSKGDVVMMFVFPIVLITTLSVGLKNMMSNSQDVFGTGDEYSIVYYTIEEGSKYKDGFNSFTDGVSETVNIKFEQVASQESVIEKVDSDAGMLHINITKDGFNLYTSKNGEKTKSKVFRSVFESMLNEYAVFETIGEFNPKAFTNLVQNKYDDYVVKDDAGEMRDVTSSEYYTFAELALIILYVSQIVAESIYKETQLLTINRVRLSKVKESALIASKVAFGVFITIIQTLLIYVYTSTVLKVNWGDNTLKFMLLFFVFGIFASIVGAMIGLAAKKDTTIAGVTSGMIFSICALGGCYTPLSMIIGIPVISKLVYLSPIYWINTATSTMISGGQSSAYMIALVVPIGLAVICLGLYTVIMKNRGGLIND